MPSGPLQQDYAQIGLKPLPKRAPGPIRGYPSEPLLLRSLRPGSLGKRRSLRDATRKTPHSTNSRRPADRGLPDKTGRLSSARSEHHASRIVARTRNRPKSRAWMPKHCRPKSLERGLLAPAPASKLVRQSAASPSAYPSSGNSATDLSARNTVAGDD